MAIQHLTFVCICLLAFAGFGLAELQFVAQFRNGTAVQSDVMTAIPAQFNSNSIDFEPFTASAIAYDPHILQSMNPAILEATVVVITLETPTNLSTYPYTFTNSLVMIQAMSTFHPRAWIVNRPGRGSPTLLFSCQ